MSSKATNLALLLLSLVGGATGMGAFLAGSPHWRVVLWLHAVAGFTLLLLFYWKRRIIVRSLRRRGLGLQTSAALLLLALVIGAFVTGVLWSTTGLPALAGYSGVTVHAALGAAVVGLLLLHASMRWPRMRRLDLVSRRVVLRSGLLLAGGVALWRSSEAASALLQLSGSRRRFTGSRPAQQFSGNDFPASNWLTDDPDPLDLAAWRLHVSGHVMRSFTLTRDAIEATAAVTAVIDCTGGWYSQQEWRGVSLASLLDAAGVQSGAASVIVRASTGYWRRYTLQESRGALLATHVGDAFLSHAHGAPLRLVMPGKRGFEWVKWVTSIEVSTAAPLLKWPLPIS